VRTAILNYSDDGGESRRVATSGSASAALNSKALPESKSESKSDSSSLFHNIPTPFRRRSDNSRSVASAVPEPSNRTATPSYASHSVTQTPNNQFANHNTQFATTSLAISSPAISTPATASPADSESHDQTTTPPAEKKRSGTPSLIFRPARRSRSQSVKSQPDGRILEQSHNATMQPSLNNSHNAAMKQVSFANDVAPGIQTSNSIVAKPGSTATNQYHNQYHADSNISAFSIGMGSGGGIGLGNALDFIQVLPRKRPGPRIPDFLRK
jgi:hypothetical protein